jgi:hypothetical protein
VASHALSWGLDRGPLIPVDAPPDDEPS